jgi:hypothetical protein
MQFRCTSSLQDVRAYVVLAKVFQQNGNQVRSRLRDLKVRSPETVRAKIVPSWRSKGVYSDGFQLVHFDGHGYGFWLVRAENAEKTRLE